MFARRSLGPANDGVVQLRAVEPHVSADIDPINWDACVLTNHHVFVATQLDGLDVMRKNSFRDFFGFSQGSAPDCSHNIRRDFLERLDVKIAANFLDEAVKIFWNFHLLNEWQTTQQQIH